jgi:hypothetical protein
MYGDDTDEWIGKRVTLFSTEVQYQSEMVEAIRIRSKPPREAVRKPAGKAARKAPAPVPVETEDWDDDDQIPF